jgi:hypothetical protein
MAATEILMKFAWENGVGFTMTSKENNDPIVTIVDIDENGFISSLWPHTQAICEDYVKKELNRIGSEMKA